MRTIAVAFILISVPASAVESPEWLPPPPVRPPFWDLHLPIQPIRPGEDFIHILNKSNEAGAPLGQPRTGRLKQSQEMSLEAIRWKCNWDAPDARELREAPALSRAWTAEQTLSLPLPLQDSLFMFGQFASGGDIDHTQSHMKGRTGVGLKWSLFHGGDFQIRTGPVVKYEDDPQSRLLERTPVSVEMQAKVALMGPLQLQYAGEALPSFAQAAGHTVLQDLKFALPFGSNREVNLGAKYRWEDSLTPTPWTQRAELYMGLKFQH